MTGVIQLSIRTWNELIEAGIALTKEDAENAFVNAAIDTIKDLVIIENEKDGLLRLNQMAELCSVPHLVGGEMKIVVIEGAHALLSGYGPFLLIDSCGSAHYRTADDLGLDGMPHDNNTYSVLVPHNQLHHIEFTEIPRPLEEWERELLGERLRIASYNKLGALHPKNNN